MEAPPYREREEATLRGSRRLLLAISCIVLAAVAVTALACSPGGTSGGNGAGGGSSQPVDSAPATTSTPSTTESDSPMTLELTAEDDGDSFTVRKGGTVSVALEANPGTGFMWELELDDPEASLLEQSREPTFESSDPGAVGASGTMTFTFRAADAGEMPLRLVYLPPDGSAPTEVFEVTLIVE